jgi:hypothetical protein
VSAHIQNRRKLSGRVFRVKQDSRLDKNRLYLAAGGQHPPPAVHNHPTLGLDCGDRLLLLDAKLRVVFFAKILEIKASAGQGDKNRYQETNQNNCCEVFHFLSASGGLLNLPRNAGGVNQIFQPQLLDRKLLPDAVLGNARGADFVERPVVGVAKAGGEQHHRSEKKRNKYEVNPQPHNSNQF